MVTIATLRKVALVTAAVVVALGVLAPAGYAAEEGAQAQGSTSVGDGLRVLGLALGAGIAMAGAALATGRAQGAIGAGGTGALAEKPELFGRIFILVALPETVVVLGFVMAFLIIGNI